MCRIRWASNFPGVESVLKPLLAVSIGFVAWLAGIEVSRSSAADQPAKTTPVFERDVVPILKAYCWKCHGAEGRAAGLDMRTLPFLLAGGKHGPAVVRGSAEKSLLFQKLSSRQMPPGKELKPTEEHVATVRRWIESGAGALYVGGSLTEEQAPPVTADDRNWWAFRKPVRPAVPAVKQLGRVRTPIDAFLLKKLEDNRLDFSPDAEQATLIRRLFLDLTGLPPSLDEVETFLADRSPNAYEKLVDRLLASPHYGERWGRHWLDAAGYVDTIGSDNDASIINPRVSVWKYRDYVIRAVNDDKPFDRFLLEQLAGDELIDWRNAEVFTPQIRELLIATGFLRQAADVTYAPELNTADIRHQVLYDTIQIVSSNFLGLTLHCAQCHSHKFDPIPQADYYRLAAIFAPAYDSQNWKHSKQRFLHNVSAEEKRPIDAKNAMADRQIGELKKQIAEVRRPFEQSLLEEKLKAIPEPIRADTLAAITTEAEKRNAVQKYLTENLGPLLKVMPEEVDKKLDETAKRKTTELDKQIANVASTKQDYGKIQALWDLGPPPPSYLFRRGNYSTPGPQVTAAVPVVLDDPDDPFVIPKPQPGSSSSGYRTALARWLTKSDHPLTARVFVNRIWQHYFGRGIVATPANFGASGALPTHPELLDWLATELVRGGWSVKQLHWLILTSTAYRQSSMILDFGLRIVDSETNPQSIDPENRLWWRMPLRRLESEIVRDAVLSVSGALNLAQSGPPVPLKPNPDGSVEIDLAKLADPQDRFRRSLYIFARRNYQLSELNVFDQPIVAHNCTRRTSSAVVLQSLTMLNGKFIFEQSKRFARRVAQSVGEDEQQRIVRAFRLALSRSPTAEEIELSHELLHRQIQRYRDENKNLTSQQAADKALIDLCQMLLNTNEFLYVQ